MWEATGAALIGLVLLVFAAKHLVLGAGRLAQRLGVPKVVVGVVVIGLGTSAPEFVVSGLAAHRGDTELALGNLVGSNIFNVTLILGVSAIVAPLAVHARIPRREAPVAVAGVVLFGVLALIGIGVLAGLLLAGLLVGALLVLVVLARAAPADPVGIEAADMVGTRRPPTNGLIEPARTVFGLAGTLGGAQLLVVSASSVAIRLGVAPSLVGFTLVAVGTSLPELVTAVQAQRRRDTDLVVGNLLGSNLFNSLGGGALVGLAARGHPASLGYPILLAMVATTVLAWVLLHRGSRVSRGEAVVLLLAYLAVLPLVGVD